MGLFMLSQQMLERGSSNWDCLVRIGEVLLQ